MTKYEELQAALQAEMEKIVTDFQTKAKAGDYVIYKGNTLGVLVKRLMARGGTELVLFPITISAATTEPVQYSYAVMLNPEEIAEMQLVSLEQAGAFIQKKVAEFTTEKAEIPF